MAKNHNSELAAVQSIEKSFSFCTLSTASSIATKRHLLLDERVAVLGIDVLRGATTACAVLAKGAIAVKFYSKKKRSLQALFGKLRRLTREGTSCVAVGESGGTCIAGCVETNSPQGMQSRIVKGRHVLLSTSNMGELCERVLSIIVDNHTRWYGEFLVPCFTNLETTVDIVRKQSPTRVVLCCSGCSMEGSLEDLCLAGHLIQKLRTPADTCDDTSRIAIAIAERYPSAHSLYSDLLNSRIQKVLSYFGRDDDLAASLVGTGIDQHTLSRMARAVPVLYWQKGESWFGTHRY